jgi:hypothetical protein
MGSPSKWEFRIVVSLLLPWISYQMIASTLQVASLPIPSEHQTIQILGTLPSIQLWDIQSKRRAVFWCQRFTIKSQGQQTVLHLEAFYRDICRVPLHAMSHAVKKETINKFVLGIACSKNRKRVTEDVDELY